MPISGYGLMIALGLVCSGGAARLLTLRFSLDFYDFLILLVYTVSLGILGAKLAYLSLNAARIHWALLMDPDYLAALLQGGFIFYGGIPLGLAGLFLGGRIHRISVAPYLRVCLPLLPLAHGFGRVGCFFAGCCYGVEYHGPFSVIYHRSVAAPVNLPLFPVQLVEALAEFLIFALLLWLVFRYRGLKNLLPLYLILYGTLRFSLEFFRSDAERGHWGIFSTSQWISLFCCLGGTLYLFLHRMAYSSRKI